jgi:hypothetical protein
VLLGPKPSYVSCLTCALALLTRDEAVAAGEFQAFSMDVKRSHRLPELLIKRYFLIEEFQSN